MSEPNGGRRGARLSRPAPRLRAAIGIGAAILAIALPACHGSAKPPPPEQPLAFGSTGLDGGGFVNVVAYDPSGSGVVLAGGDVSGILRSTDLGSTWTPSNTGVHGLAQLKVAALLFSPRVPGEVYAAVGDEGRGGGLLVSTDDGRSWSLRSSSPDFSGGNNYGTPLPAPHPRSTGTLLGADPTRGLIYAATYDLGVMRSADDGRTWTTLGLAGSFLRGLALDPAHPDTVYVSTFDDAVYRTTTASSSGAFRRLASSPADAEELAIVGQDLYAAAGIRGIMSSSDGGESWRPLLVGEPGGLSWEAIAGYQACGRTVLFAGADGGGPGSLVRSTDGGATWTSATGGRSGVHVQVGGPGGPRWWLASQPDFLLGGVFYTASQIAVEPGQPPSGDCLRPQVLVAGRSGIWGTPDGGSNWYPMVKGLGVTIAHETVVDPATPNALFVAAADWGLLESNDGGVTFAARPASGTGFGLALDASVDPADLYLGVGSPIGNSRGEVLASSSPGAERWTRTGLESAAGGRVLAVAERRIGGEVVLLAAVDGEGLWRKVGSASWSRVNAAALPLAQGGGGVSFAWPSGTTVFLYDREGGLWRSGDAGATWTLLWAKRSAPPLTGSLATDPTAPGRLFLSVGDDGLYRIDGATSVDPADIGAHTMKVGDFAHPGPVTVDADGTVFATELATDGPADLKTSRDHGGSWRSIADPAYRASAVFPLGLTVSPNGDLFVALDGNGLLVGRPSA